MMNTNRRLYQHLIILSALANASFVLAADVKTTSNKDQAAVIPAAPSGPYRSQNATGKNIAKNIINYIEKNTNK